MLKDKAEEKITARIDASIKMIEMFIDSFANNRGGWHALNAASRELSRLFCTLDIYEATIHPDSYNPEYKTRVAAVEKLVMENSPLGI